MTNKIKGLRFGLFCKRKKAVPRVYAFINRRACCGCFHWSINRGYYTRVFLAPIVFVWNDFVRSFCFYLYNLDERIRTFEGCILNVWICIHKEAIQVRIYISVPALEEGWEWGSMTEGVVETGVLSQCTIIHPGRFRWTCGNSFIYFLFVAVFLFLLSLRKWVDRW